MLIEERSLRHWMENFYGYGSWQAKFWLIAYEESGGNLPEEVADKFNYFDRVHSLASEPTLCDLREVYKHLTFRDEGPKANAYGTRYEYRFEKNAVQSTIWRNLAAFVHGYENRTLPDFLKYQQTEFADPSKTKEALISLYPLPGPHNHAWYYSWLEAPGMPFLKSRKLYEEHVYQSRVTALLSQIKKYQPEVVLMYGMSNINSLKESIGNFFQGVKFKMAKQIKLQLPQHHYTEVNSTKLLITTQIPALRHNRVETGFDWALFGRTVKSEMQV